MNRRSFLMNALSAGAAIPFGRAALIARPRPSRPNILLCISDDQSYPHAGAYGCSWVRTPGFDRVAREGLLFSRAYTPNAKCAPSRSCLITGRNSWQLEAAANHIPYFPARFKSFVEVLQENGYFAGFTAKGWAPGNAGETGGRPRNLTGVPFNRKTLLPPVREISGNDYAANFSDFLEARPQGQPFCFWYGSLEPHRAYSYGSGMRLAGKKPADLDRVPTFWPDNETVRTDMLDYAYETEHFDSHVGRMLRLLEQQGELENTLVIVTSDNGMPFPRVKGQCYELSNHMPLAVMWKAGIVAPGRTVEDFVSFIDIAPTLLEIAGISIEGSGMAPVQGESLSSIFQSRRGGIVEAARDHVLIGKERHDIGRPHDWGYPIRAIVKGDFLYLRNFEVDRWPAGNPETGYLNCDGSPTKTLCVQARKDGRTRRYWELSFGKRPSEELYDIREDPDCIRNLASDGHRRQLTESLQKQLYGELRRQEDPRMDGKGRVFDEYPYADETTRGFYERFMKGEKLKAGWVNPTDFDPGPP